MNLLTHIQHFCSLGILITLLLALILLLIILIVLFFKVIKWEIKTKKNWVVFKARDPLAHYDASDPLSVKTDEEGNVLEWREKRDRHVKLKDKKEDQ